jgi:farnesyl-diphosphate farnesyltransferase
LLSLVKQTKEDVEVLKGVSRSFFLSLRVLPAPMRRGACLGYLLARTSDTLADSVGLPVAVRSEWLLRFKKAVAEKSVAPRWPISLINAASDPKERRLLECSGEIFERLRALPVEEAVLVQEVLEIITDGQLMDLQIFAEASQQHPIVLPDAATLDDYTWKVAGSVGAFWTKLGFLTLGPQFSKAAESELIERGVAYGQGLQLINILRDLPADLAAGRCYLPVKDPQQVPELLEAHARWLTIARRWISEGERYAKELSSWRLRVGTVLPALIAVETVKLLQGVSWEALQKRPKIPRWRVYLLLLRAIFWS